MNNNKKKKEKKRKISIIPRTIKVVKLNEQRYLTEANTEVDMSELSDDNFKAARLKCFNKKL